MSQTIVHPLAPIADEESRILILGTMPSPKSREIGFYYGHPQNRFWRILATLFNEPVPHTNEERTDLLHRHGIALWDVLHSCRIEGASDASIREPMPNDIAGLLVRFPNIEVIYTTGGTAWKLYQKLCRPNTGRDAIVLPSPSAANAAWNVEHLAEAYRVILSQCR